MNNLRQEYPNNTSGGDCTAPWQETRKSEGRGYAAFPVYNSDNLPVMNKFASARWSCQSTI